ncbi:agmatine deiminase [Croceibacterium mercuriale]|uniref:Agmatine deiminase n=1 Tax=Croceibacterium mercuriale TaxID=1572751 RepID=A0A0B2BYJ2_9SPHN|nr:agmatine deiminase family protein [Croceibacterium mercuriale]KHL24915.1 agmatine deiminase [Croceibacterium mercuriale]
MTHWHMPPEWAPQDWLWIGFPHDPAEWPDLAAAQVQLAAFASAVAESGQEVRLLVRDAANAMRAKALTHGAVQLERRDYGDVWLRDTGPLVLRDGAGKRLGQRFCFNGWGGKFVMDGDETIGAELAQDAGLAVRSADWVLEGGAIDGDGTGLVVTTEQCLLNPNRNPHLSRQEIEARLKADLGFTRVLWLGEGLQGDHTDGHVDNLARFVGPGRIAIPQASAGDDPNSEIFTDAKRRAEAAGLEVLAVPSPGWMGEGDEAEPASYMNFAICNKVVVVPTYGSPLDEEAVTAIGAMFPDRVAVGLSADAVLGGGGSFHCASQQMPSAG